MTNDEQSMALFIIYYVISSIIVMNVYISLDKEKWIFEDYLCCAVLFNVFLAPFVLIWGLSKYITYIINGR